VTAGGIYVLHAVSVYVSVFQTVFQTVLAPTASVDQAVSMDVFQKVPSAWTPTTEAITLMRMLVNNPMAERLVWEPVRGQRLPQLRTNDVAIAGFRIASGGSQVATTRPKGGPDVR
jgi:hypothetical protein